MTAYAPTFLTGKKALLQSCIYHFGRLPGRLGAWLGCGGLRFPVRGSTRRRFVGTGDRSLHLGNARVPPGHSAIEGSEDGGGRRAASGRERGHPRLRQLLVHLQEERHRGSSEKPIVQPRGLGTGRSVDLQPDEE